MARSGAIWRKSTRRYFTLKKTYTNKNPAKRLADFFVFFHSVAFADTIAWRVAMALKPEIASKMKRLGGF